MPLEIPTYSEHLLSDFVEKEREKAMAFIRKNFSLLSEQDCEDVIQESFIVLYGNSRQGKLRDMTASLSTYFISICINKAHEALRRNGHTVGVADDADLDFLSEVKDEKVQQLLTLDDQTSLIEAKEALARQIVQDLPHPCQELLWGFYRDNCSMKMLADRIDSTVGSVKVTKHRCQEKFRKRWSSLANEIYCY